MTVELDEGLARIVRELRALGYTVTSTVRTIEDNARVGGSDTSLHLSGQAFDVIPRDDGDWLLLMADVVVSARRHAAPVRILCETDHLHVDLHPYPGLSVEVPRRLRGRQYARIYAQAT